MQKEKNEAVYGLLDKMVAAQFTQKVIWHMHLDDDEWQIALLTKDEMEDMLRNVHNMDRERFGTATFGEVLFRYKGDPPKKDETGFTVHRTPTGIKEALEIVEKQWDQRLT